ncbi:MAG: hypothetical protein A3A82_03995 [Candidatus Pacebacteria bacterium RIFCSPLOWO2_01_FULL_47_12]|nr:MAG: hypothetical protein A3A82_03995 [Candidatus Pacebacteria bacterium RIFCSPLOWO2_01_FULL_47_12]
MTLYPSLLSDSVSELQKQLDMSGEIDEISTVQIDIVDGIFADTVTITPADIPRLDFGELQYDLHLMTLEPLDYVYELVAECDKTQVRACIAQVEKLSYQAPFLEEVLQHQWQAGLSLDLFTPLSAIDDASWSQMSVLQLMSIEAGVQGSAFHPRIFEKIVQAQKRLAHLDHLIELIIDGGIHEQQLPQLRQRGITSIAVGSALWTATDIVAAVDTFLKG